VPVQAESDASGRFAILCITDPYTFDEWRHAMETILRASPYASRAALLIDRRDATAPSREFVDKMIVFFVRHSKELGSGRAAIIAGDDLGFGMGRMTELKSEMHIPAIRIRTFREYDTAVRWLADA
jgi:hypothetical protein